MVAPLAGTVATGSFVAGSVAAGFFVAEADAAEIVVAAGTTETYNAGNTYILSGGTLDVPEGSVSSAITVTNADSVISLGSGAVLSPLRVTLGENVSSFKLAGTGTYDLASATQMYGANVSSADWTGTVSIANSTGVGNFNINNYGNSNSAVKLSGVAGWLALGVTFNPTMILEDAPDASALNQTDGSSGREYAFNSVRGSGTFERGGTKFAGAVSYAFTGDVSGWTGTFLNNYGQTTLIFRGGATQINLANITHNAGYDMGLQFNGASAATVNTDIKSTAGGAINMTINNSGGVTFNKTVEVNSLTANGPMTVGSTGSVSVANSATLAGDVTVNGTLNLNGGATLSNSIVNNGTLNIVGALAVQSTNLAQTPVGDVAFTDGDNGIQTAGSVEYTVIENGSGAKLNVSGTSLSFDGDTSLKLDAAGKVVRKADLTSTRYWVNKGDVSLSLTNAASYFMNGGTLVLDKTDAAAQGTALVGVEGNKGTIKLTNNASLTGDVTTKSAADLLITNGATLSIGNGKNSSNYAGSFSSVTLDNGKLSINALPGVIQNLTVTANNGEISFPDYMNGPTAANAYDFSGVVRLDGKLTVKGSWKFVARFNQLSGAGSLEFNGPTSGEDLTQVLIGSLKDFTGDLSFVQNNGSNPYYKVTLNSGSAKVNMNSLTLGKGAGKGADHKNIDMILTVDPGASMTLNGALTMQSNTTLSVDGAAGLNLNGGLTVQGADNSIVVVGDSALNLSKLDVTNGASLTLTGKLSAIGMNQVGSVTTTDMKLVDGASLVYGADAATLKITADNLLGKVKVDLNSLTDTQSKAIAGGTGLDLGIDSSVSKSLISVVADNVRNAVLDNSGESWKLVSGVVSMYWETGSGNWDASAKNWAFRDEAAANQSYIAGTDAIFTNDANATVTVTAAPSVQNIEIASGKYTFNSNFTGNLAIGNDLVVGSNATAIFNKVGSADKKMTVGGNVSVSKGSSLEVNMDSMSVAGALSGDGSVKVNSDLSLGASSSAGQLVVVGDISMTGSTKDLTVGGKSSASSLTNVSKLTVKSGGSMKVAADTKVGKLAGEGSFETAKLTLTSGASSIGTLKADSVTMGKNVTLDVTTLNAPSVTMTLGSVAVEDGKTLLTADKTTAASELSLKVQDVADLKKLTNGAELTIATIGTPGGTVTGSLIAPVSSDPGTSVITKSTTEFSVTSNLRGFGYTLVVSPDNTAVTLQVGRDNDGWIGAESDVWTQGEQTGWETGFVPNPTDRAAGFFGNGSSIVTVDAGGVQTALVDVDIAKSKLEEISSYTFVGGEVVTENMIVSQGELIIANKTVVDKDTEVFTSGKLTVAEGGELLNKGNLTMTDDVALSVDSDAALTVSGKLSAEESVSITNKGVLAAESIDVDGTIENEGVLQIGTGGSIGSVEGGSVYAMTSAPGTLKIGSVNVESMEIASEGSTVELSGDSVIGSLSCTAEGTSLLSSAALTLTEAAGNQDGAVSVTAKTLTLNKIGNVFGSLNAPVITLDLADDALSSEVAALSVESIVTINPVQIRLTQATIESLPVDEENVIVSADYILMSGIDGHSVSDFSVDKAMLQEIKRRGVAADVLVKDNDLLLSLGAIEGGMTWDTADGNMLTNNGYEIPTGEGLYKALDYVEHVLVSDNKTIDLTTDGVGDAVEGNATIPAAGLIVRNLNGGGKLTLLGDGADKDAATLISTKAASSPVALEARSVKVNLGLPVGQSGILSSDETPGEIVIASAEMTDAAALYVNADATVKGETSLVEGSSLTVADGAHLTTAQLAGDAAAVVTGDVTVTGVGGTYGGSYGKSGAEITLVKGAYQSVKAGKGLTLLVQGGEGSLYCDGADAEMTMLGVGAPVGSKSANRSELRIGNVTMNDKAGKVEHHTITLNGDGSYINGSEVTASLGAEESARTLGTDKAPVLFDGKLAVNGSSVCLTMVTTKTSLNALNVNTNAPLKGAKLATLATDATIGSGNEVELIGSKDMMNLVNKYYENARLSSSGDILVDRVTDYYSAAAPSLSENATVGVEMMDDALVYLNPQGDAKKYPDLARMMNALDGAVIAGDTAEVDRLASAVAGASSAALGAAITGDMERQLRAIRNRTTTMGVDQGTVNHGMPYFNAWINAEVDNRKLSQDGSLAGYDYSTTGGTFGFDVDVTPSFTCGVAISALRGDFTSESTDELEADVDSYYLTAFARSTYRRWVHTFVASVGRSDMSLDRTVSFSGGNYTTEAETEATAFGAMYEVGYVIALDADSASCLQPVFNLSVVHNSMEGYSEKGSDAGLSVGSVDMTTVTLGAGARFQTVAGQNVFNRSSIFESRALVKFNAGDREAEADNALGALPSAGGTVTSAERGAVSLELGAGITIPIGSRSGSIFVDGSAELSSEYTGWNATVGYRLNF